MSETEPSLGGEADQPRSQAHARQQQLARTILWVRHGNGCAPVQAALLVEEIDRLQAMQAQAADTGGHALLACESALAQMRAERNALSNRMDNMMAAFTAIGKFVTHDVSGELAKAQEERDEWRRQYDMARAGWNVALDRLCRIRDVLGFEDEAKGDAA